MTTTIQLIAISVGLILAGLTWIALNLGRIANILEEWKNSD